MIGGPFCGHSERQSFSSETPFRSGPRHCGQSAPAVRRSHPIIQVKKNNIRRNFFSWVKILVPGFTAKSAGDARLIPGSYKLVISPIIARTEANLHHGIHQLHQLAMFKILEDYAPVIVPMSIDEGFLDFTTMVLERFLFR
jgi:hypothetical protein